MNGVIKHRSGKEGRFGAFAEKELKAGKTADQAAADYKVDPKFKGYVASANPMFGGPKPNMEIAYKELKK